MIVPVGKFIIVFFAFLAQLALLVTLKAWLLRKYPKLTPWNWARRWLRFVAKNGVLIAAWTATFATASSLFFAHVALYSPCILCWWQRIFMFPQVWLLWVSYKKNDKNAALLSIPLAIIGGLFALYHYVLQLSPKHPTLGFCDLDNPCTARYIYEYFHITIAGMALTGFLVIIIALLLHHYYKGRK